jgi:ADP-ribose pyrophosphatase YjhB (NUDIX family)
MVRGGPPSPAGPMVVSGRSFVREGIDPPGRRRQPRLMSGFVRRIPEGDNRERMVCAECGHIAYENPKVVVGAVVVADGAVLLCRRAIEPRHGFWTLPAGYLELGETLQDGAAREIFEEAQARVEFDGILGIFSISRIGQVHVMFRARFADEGGSPRFAAGVESLEVGLFGWNDIPWARLAFPSVRWTLDAWRRSGSGPLGVPAGNPEADPRGTRPPGEPPITSPTPCE